MLITKALKTISIPWQAFKAYQFFPLSAFFLTVSLNSTTLSATRKQSEATCANAKVHAPLRANVTQLSCFRVNKYSLICHGEEEPPT
jgi:hypothetical protein